jgi:hypothetical protein
MFNLQLQVVIVQANRATSRRPCHGGGTRSVGAYQQAIEDVAVGAIVSTHSHWSTDNSPSQLTQLHAVLIDMVMHSVIF